MTTRPLLASLCASMDDFLARPLDVLDGAGPSAIAILNANRPVFYVVSPEFWANVTQTSGATGSQSKLPVAKNGRNKQDA